MIHITIPGPPPTTTAQQKGTAAIFDKAGTYKGLRHYKKAKVQAVEDGLMKALADAVPDKPFTGPVELEIDFTFPWRKGEPAKNRVSGWMYKDTRPDLDNMVKMIADCLTKLGYFHDDGQVAFECISKRWGNEPGIDIGIDSLPKESQ